MKSITIAISLLASAQGMAFQQLSVPEILAKASLNRSSVQSARLKLEQAQLSRRSIISSLSPSVQLGYSTDIRTGGTDNDLVLTQPFDLFGRGSAFRHAGDAQVFQAEAGLRRSLGDLQAEVLEAYIAAVASTQRVAIAKKSEELARNLSMAVQGLVEGGKLPGVLATRANIELEKQRITARQRVSDYTANLKRLAGVTGVPSLEIAETFPSFPKPGSSVAELESQRADLLAIQGEIREANASVQVARTDRLPQFEIQARSTPWQSDTRGVGARFQLSFPIDTGRVRHQESAAQKKAQGAQKAYEDALRVAVTESEAAVIEINGASDTVQGLETILAATDSLVERTQVGLKEGANTLIDVLDALRAKREVEESLIDAKLALATAQVKYLKSVGMILEAQK